jgi:O-antigen/teichoic acid export membrane protein
VTLLVGTFRGALWNAAGSWTQVALNIAGIAVVARLLGPDTYGIVGLATIVTALAAMLCHGALTRSIVQYAQLREGHVDATFWLTTGLSTVAALVLVAAASPIAAWLGGPPDTAAALRALAPLLPLSAATAVLAALLERDMRFRELATAGALSTAVANLTGVVVAIAGGGLWALVAMEAVRVATHLIALARSVEWRPGRRGRIAHLRELGRFNAQVLATQVLGHADELLPRALIGGLLGPQALGAYLIGRRVFDELSRLVTGPLAGVAMSATARARHDPALLHRIVLGLYRSASLIALPVFLGAAVLAPVGVPFVFGPQWSAAVPAIQLLLLSGMRTATGVFNVSILRGLGRADLPLWLIGTGLVLQAMLIPPLAAAWDVTGAVAAMLIRTIATWPLGCVFIRHASGLPVRRQVEAGAAALTAAVVMAAGVALLDQAWGPALAALPRLSAGVAAGAVLYVAVLALVSPATVRGAGGLVGAVLRRDDRALVAGLGESR